MMFFLPVTVAQWPATGHHCSLITSRFPAKNLTISEHRFYFFAGQFVVSLFRNAKVALRP